MKKSVENAAKNIDATCYAEWLWMTPTARKRAPKAFIESAARHAEAEIGSKVAELVRRSKTVSEIRDWR